MIFEKCHICFAIIDAHEKGTEPNHDQCEKHMEWHDKVGK